MKNPSRKRVCINQIPNCGINFRSLVCIVCIFCLTNTERPDDLDNLLIFWPWLVLIRLIQLLPWEHTRTNEQVNIRFYGGEKSDLTFESFLRFFWQSSCPLVFSDQHLGSSTDCTFFLSLFLFILFFLNRICV